MSDILEYKDLVLGDNLKSDTIYCPKHIATITICGAAVIYIDEDMPFICPTKEQIKNLHDMLCIDVEVLDDDESRKM